MIYDFGLILVLQTCLPASSSASIVAEVTSLLCALYVHTPQTTAPYTTTHHRTAHHTTTHHTPHTAHHTPHTSSITHHTTHRPAPTTHRSTPTTLKVLPATVLHCCIAYSPSELASMLTRATCHHACIAGDQAWRAYPCERDGCGLYSVAENLPPPPFWAAVSST